jgi:YHS domain-containing protein
MSRVFLVSISVLALSALVLAEDKSATDKPAATTAPATAPSTQASVPVNKKCPISGDAVDPKGKTVIYKGQVIGFCCEDCVEPFKKNPDKYAKDIK